MKFLEVLGLGKQKKEILSDEQVLMSELSEVENKIAEMRRQANSGMDNAQTDLTAFLNTLEAQRNSLRARLEEIGKSKPELLLVEEVPEK